MSFALGKMLGAIKWDADEPVSDHNDHDDHEEHGMARPDNVPQKYL
jgi:hypothetical protein